MNIKQLSNKSVKFYSKSIFEKIFFFETIFLNIPTVKQILHFYR